MNWLDLKKTADEATKPATPGEYVTVCVKSEVKQAQSSGADMIVVQLEVDEGPAKGKMFFNNIVFTPDNAFALMMFFKKIGAFGIDDNILAQQPTMQQIADMMKGRRLICVVGIRTWQGADRNEVNEYKPLAAGISAPILGQGHGAPANIPASVVPTLAPVGSAPSVPAF